MARSKEKPSFLFSFLIFLFAFNTNVFAEESTAPLAKTQPSLIESLVFELQKEVSNPQNIESINKLNSETAYGHTISDAMVAEIRAARARIRTNQLHPGRILKNEISQSRRQIHKALHSIPEYGAMPRRGKASMVNRVLFGTNPVELRIFQGTRHFLRHLILTHRLVNEVFQEELKYDLFTADSVTHELSEVRGYAGIFEAVNTDLISLPTSTAAVQALQLRQKQLSDLELKTTQQIRSVQNDEDSKKMVMSIRRYLDHDLPGWAFALREHAESRNLGEAWVREAVENAAHSELIHYMGRSAFFRKQTPRDQRALIRDFTQELGNPETLKFLIEDRIGDLFERRHQRELSKLKYEVWLLESVIGIMPKETL